ncbi:MAG: hypothetical protein IKY30_01300 [Oscillospiraceae bacterium]|nr:hypothetical protein [Oscillospiraceae bacterium]
MKELVEDNIYTTLAEKYDELLLDYVLISFDEEYCGKESHKRAVIEAISALNIRVRVGNSLNHPQFYVDEDKMYCTKCDIEDFFYDGNSSWETSGNTRIRKTPSHMTYWWAFFEPPYGVPYSKEDFRKINHSLFPAQFRSDLEIYSWNDDFSNYFEDGKEWWGTALWSVYDKWMNRFVIIGASLTD